jgi:hypothetical protein
MKAKLLKTAKGHYVLVDETKETYDKGFLIGNSRESNVLKLSIQNCDEIFGVIDVEKLALDSIKGYEDPGYVSGGFIHYKQGFNKAIELNKDKLFTEDQMWEMFIFGESFKRKIKAKTIEDKPMGEIFNDKIQSLQQTEWNVEIVADIYKDELANLDWFTNFVYGSLSMIGYEFYTEDLGICIVEGIEHPDYPGGTFIKTNKGKVEWNYQNNKTIFVGEDKFRPKLDKDGCLILKRL